ncbi:MAG: HAD-IA family hydrolase [Alphaproteobacteria bacterium]
MPQLLGLIFDLDGTLVDSAADLRQALNALLAGQSRRALSLPEVKSMIGDGMPAMIHRAFAATGEPLSEQGEQAVFQVFLRLYQAQKASPEQLYPHALEILTAFRNMHVKIGLCTNKPYLSTVKLLDDIGITDLFDFVAGGDSFPVYKPHPGHLLGVVKGLKVSPQTCVMIGDSVNDIRAAQSAHIASIAVSHGYGNDVGSLGADAVISGFADLAQTLGSLGFDFVD